MSRPIARPAEVALRTALWCIAASASMLLLGLPSPSLAGWLNEGEVNIGHHDGNQDEVSIATNPTNPNQVFVISMHELQTPCGTPCGLFSAYSTDGGQTWHPRLIADGNDGLLLGRADPAAAWDQFGNLFISYLVVGERYAIAVARSIDGGAHFEQVEKLTSAVLDDVDKPWIGTGPVSSPPSNGSVWVIYNGELASHARSAEVTCPEGEPLSACTVTAFSPESADSKIDGVVTYPSNLSIGSDGRALVTHHESHWVYTKTDADGRGSTSSFYHPPSGEFELAHLFDLDAGGTSIPAQPDRKISGFTSVAFDPNDATNGRAYLVYTDEEDPYRDPDIQPFFDVRFRFTNDVESLPWLNGSSIYDYEDISYCSEADQFLPAIAVDETTGKIAIAWLDTCNDCGDGCGIDSTGVANDEVEVFARVGESQAPNGDVAWGSIIQVSGGGSWEGWAQGGSDGMGMNKYGQKIGDVDRDYGEYLGLAFHDGSFYVAWPDNSNSTGDNPPLDSDYDMDNGVLDVEFDIYVARISLDTDDDGVPDYRDNCVLRRNGESEAPNNQCDTDQDGYGNACDADTNDDNAIGIPDFGTFTATFGLTGSELAADTNCDGGVGIPDFGTFTALFGYSAGPSGLSCAGTTPCP